MDVHHDDGHCHRSVRVPAQQTQSLRPPRGVHVRAPRHTREKVSKLIILYKPWRQKGFLICNQRECLN